MVATDTEVKRGPGRPRNDGSNGTPAKSAEEIYSERRERFLKTGKTRAKNLNKTITLFGKVLRSREYEYTRDEASIILTMLSRSFQGLADAVESHFAVSGKTVEKDAMDTLFEDFE